MALCHAKSSRTGKPCKREAIKGGAVCRSHGGGAPQVKAAAKLRLLALVDPALAVLARSMAQKPVPMRKSFPDGDKGKQAYESAVLTHLRDQVPAAVALKAATEVLDRAGLDLENKTEMGAREITVRFVKADSK